MKAEKKEIKRLTSRYYYAILLIFCLLLFASCRGYDYNSTTTINAYFSGSSNTEQ